MTTKSATYSSGSTISFTWTTQWVDDGLAGDPEFFFEARTPTGYNSSKVSAKSASDVEVYRVGSVSVTIEPSGAQSAGAKWHLTSGPDTAWKNSGVIIPNVPIGSYTVEYSSISGWDKPSNQSISVTRNNPATTTGTYVQQLGSVRATIEPVGARTLGAQWRLTSGPDTGPKDSGTTISGIPVGTYTVEYSSISGWDKPGNQSVSVTKNNTATPTGTYVKLIGPSQIGLVSRIYG